MRRFLNLFLAVSLAACAASEKKEPERAGPPPIPVEFTGNDGVSTRALRFAARRELASFQTKGRRAADLADAAYAMELELRRDGYAHARVKFVMEPSEPAVERARFVIEGGPLTRIEAISFPGAVAIGPKVLIRFLPGGEGAKFRQNDVDNATGEIERAYLLDGFLKVEVGPTEVTWNEEKSLATIRIPVDQGPQYLVRTIIFDGDVPAEVEERIARDLRDQPFYARLPVEAAARLRARLFDHGHQRARVKADVTFKGTDVTVRIHAEKGPKFRLRELKIEGTRRSKERFIKARVPFEPGDLLEQDRIDDAVDSLYETGVFRKAEVAVTHTSEEASVADLLVEVEELEARSVSFDVGWGSYELLRGGVRYQDRNFMGLGRRLTVGAQTSMKGYGVNSSIADNYLLGRDTTLRLGGEVFQREEPSFTRFGYRIHLSVTQKFDGPFVITVGYRIDSQEATDIKSILPQEEGEFITSAGLFATISRDTRKSKLLPSKGSVSELGIFWSTEGLGADLNFFEIRGSWFGFFRLAKRLVLGAGVRFISRPILDDLPTLPIQKRLFLGGATTIRSFKQSRVGPFDPTTNEPIGGETSASAHVELRSRVWRELHVAVFYEIGMVSLNSLTIERPAGQAVGAGLRYYTPVGPIRIDAGYNPGELFSMNTRWAFHLAFGFSF